MFENQSDLKEMFGDVSIDSRQRIVQQDQIRIRISRTSQRNTLKIQKKNIASHLMTIKMLICIILVELSAVFVLNNISIGNESSSSARYFEINSQSNVRFF
jgi:hypothetical protein